MVSLELATNPAAEMTYAELGQAVGLSASEANQAAHRAVSAGLLRPSLGRTTKPQVNVRALLEFLEHGVRYAFFAVPGNVVRGMRTAHSAPPLNAIIQPGNELPLVWPDPEGDTRGRSLPPLYRTVPIAARRNTRLYELLALVDALRCGGARERKTAMAELERRITDAEAK